MRKTNLFSVVLSLFLLVPASITRAQSVSLTGVVYQNNTAKIPFTVPEGKINVFLPDDMAAGSQIKGTVLYEAVGKTEKQKQKNLDLLKQYVVTIGDAVLDGNILRLNPSAGTGNASGNFNLPDKWWGTAHGFAPASLLSMKQPVAKAEIPLIISSKLISGQGTAEPVPTESISFSYEKMKSEYKIQKKVITSGENIVLQKSSPILVEHEDHAMMAEFNINNKEVTPVCSSPRQTVIAVPRGTVGKTSITAKDNNGKIVFEDEVYVVDIKASIDKNNLQKNERTNMHVSADGAKDCPYPISMGIVNHASEIVVLDKGVHQTYQYDPFESMREGLISPLNIDQGVTGVTPGAYNITANLILPTVAFGDVFHQPKSALNSPEDYNAWADALKKDLKAYADKQGNDEVGKAAKANAEKAIDNIPKCYDKNKLDECKAFADAYLRPVNIPKGAATMWVCGFEAYKAAIKAITGTLGGKAELIDWEVIKNGLEFIRNMGEQLNDEGLQNGANGAKKLVETIQKAGETKEKLQELNDKLNELNNSVKKEISNNPSQPHAYQMKDLQITTFINDIAGYRTMNGTHAELNINSQSAAGVLSVNKSMNGTYEMQIIPGTSAELSSWINSFVNSNPAPAKLDIIVPPKSGAADKTLDFKNAFITEIEFPKMDAGAKEAFAMKITIRPEQIEYSAGGGKLKTTVEKKEKQWTTSNFKIELGNLPCSSITKLELPKFTAKIAKDLAGPAKDYRITPGKLEYPNITFYLPEIDSKPWVDWYKHFEKTNETKTGSFTIRDANDKSQFTINLDDIKPVQINPAGEGGYKVTIASITPAKGDISGGQQINIGPHPVNDLIGVFNPFSKILFYTPDYQSQVFSKLQPQLRTDGKYDVNVLSVNRKPMQMAVDLVPATSMILFQQDEGCESKLRDWVCDQQDKKQEEKKDRTPAERIGEKWDSTGTGYRFYKNARCERFKEGGETACSEQLIFPSGNIKEPKKTGKYEKLVYSPLSHCFKGTEFCTEMYFVDLVKYIYDDANCKRLIDVVKYYAWSCE